MFFITAAHNLIENYDELHIYSVIDKKVKIDSGIFKIEIFYSNYNADIALIKVEDFKMDTKMGIETNDSNHGDSITIAGYPNYSQGSTATIYEGKIIGKRNFFGYHLHKTDANIIKGMSGGAVFNDNMNLIGIIVRGNHADNVNDNFNEYISINSLQDDIKNILKLNDIYI